MNEQRREIERLQDVLADTERALAVERGIATKRDQECAELQRRLAHEPAPVLLSQERHAIWVTLQTCIERSVPLDPTAKKLLMQLYDRATVPPVVIRSESVDFLQGLFFESFNVKVSRENTRSILEEALRAGLTKEVAP